MAATGNEIDINLTGPDLRQRGRLLSVARPIPLSTSAASRPEIRWPEGVTWLPYGDGNISTDAAECDFTYDKVARSLPGVAAQPAFLLYDALTCSTLSSSVAMLAERLRKNLGAGNEEGVYTSAAFAAELETGSASSADISLTGSATYPPTIVSDVAVNLALAIHGLEQHLADVLHGGEGVLHLTPGLLTIAVADGLVEWRDGQYRTPTGHVVVGDAGHGGATAPEGGTAAVGGESWIYATGPVWYLMGATKGIESSVDGDTQVYLLRNENRPLVERYGIVVFDPETLGAVKASNAASDGGGGGGGGGGLTNAELRASPVEVTGSFSVSGTLTDAELRASPVDVAGPLTDAELRASDVPVSGPLTDTELRADPVPVTGGLTDAELRASAIDVNATSAKSDTATLTNVNDTTSSTTLAANNANRLGLIVENDSSEDLYLKYGSGASSTSRTVKIIAGGYWEMPQPVYTGVVAGAWAADSSGAARVTELT